MGLPGSPKRIFSAAASGTQNSSVFQVRKGEIFSLQIAHPGPGTTTTYTLEGSNTPEDVGAGSGGRGPAPDYANAVFTDTDARDNDNVALGAAAKAAAENFPVEVEATMDLYRVHMVTTLGSGVITIDLAREDA